MRIGHETQVVHAGIAVPRALIEFAVRAEGELAWERELDVQSVCHVETVDRLKVGAR